jgi:hypothetical protein
MTKSWAKPYLTILKDKLSVWEETHSPANETKVAQSVVRAIEQFHGEEDNEDDIPDDLETASTVNGTPSVQY